MAEIIYPRFNTIYATREVALAKLSELSRSYGEPVAIRYYNNSKTICVILAIFKSAITGDFEISYDSNPELKSKVYNVTKENPSLTDEDTINSVLFGKTPIIGDVVIIFEATNSLTKSYIYTDDKEWKLLSTPYGPLSTTKIGDTLVSVVNEDGTSDLEVKLDNSTIVYNKDKGGLTVNIINGGTF